MWRPPPDTVAVWTAGDLHRVHTGASTRAVGRRSAKLPASRALDSATAGCLHPWACGGRGAPWAVHTHASCPRASCPLHGRHEWLAPGPRPQQSQLARALDLPVAAGAAVEASIALVQHRPELPGGLCGSRATRNGEGGSLRPWPPVHSAQAQTTRGGGRGWGTGQGWDGGLASQDSGRP